MKMRTSFWLVASFLVATSGTTQAGLIPISQPTADYISSTTVIPITVSDFTDVSSLSDGNLTISFSDVMHARTVPFSWGTWGSPPDTESSTPRILTSNLIFDQPNPTTRTFTFSQPLSIFGLEAEPLFFGLFTMTLEFFNGDDLVGSITRDANGLAGALLFAGLATGGDVFTKAVLTTTDTEGFGTAQYRYALAQVQVVPEPSSLALVTIGPLGFGYVHHRRRIAVR